MSYKVSVSYVVYVMSMPYPKYVPTPLCTKRMLGREKALKQVIISCQGLPWWWVVGVTQWSHQTGRRRRTDPLLSSWKTSRSKVAWIEEVKESAAAGGAVFSKYFWEPEKIYSGVSKSEILSCEIPGLLVVCCTLYLSNCVVIITVPQSRGRKKGFVIFPSAGYIYHRFWDLPRISPTPLPPLSPYHSMVPYCGTVLW